MANPQFDTLRHSLFERKKSFTLEMIDGLGQAREARPGC
jgi:hypothetical protein